MANQNILEKIYNNHVDDLYTYALYLGFDKEMVMDAIHDVFCKLAEKYEVLDEVVNIKFFLFRSLKNRLIDIYKSKKEYFEIDSNVEKHNKLSFNFVVNIDDEIINKEDGEIVRRQITEMLDSLTDKQREVIYLRYIQEYEYAQIAEILNISIHGCRKLVSKSILSLREKYGAIVVLLLLV